MFGEFKETSKYQFIMPLDKESEENTLFFAVFFILHLKENSPSNEGEEANEVDYIYSLEDSQPSFLNSVEEQDKLPEKFEEVNGGEGEDKEGRDGGGAKEQGIYRKTESEAER